MKNNLAPEYPSNLPKGWYILALIPQYGIWNKKTVTAQGPDQWRVYHGEIYATEDAFCAYWRGKRGVLPNNAAAVMHDGEEQAADYIAKHIL